MTELNSLDILKAVVKVMDITVMDILARKRKPAFVIGRQLCAYLLYHKLGLTYAKAGKLLANRKHCTILFAVRQATNLLQVKDKVFVAAYKACLKELGIDERNK